MRKIKICALFAYVNQGYIDYFETNYDVEWVQEYDEDVTFALFTGGPDVNPALYNENKGNFTWTDEERDEIEVKFFNSLPTELFKIGICKGGQLLTVLAGGKLIQHVTGHMDYHNIITHENEVIPVTSDHHQMMYPFDMDINQYKILARSEINRSDKYLNGNNELMKIPMNFVEPEIVYYNEINALTCQGHPEYSTANELFKQLFVKLINEKI